MVCSHYSLILSYWKSYKAIKEITGIELGKKLPVLTDNMTVYVDNPMTAPKTVSRISRFSKVIKYNYISTYYQWTGIKNLETVPFIIAPQNWNAKI